MIVSNDTLDQIQEDVVTYLQNDPFFLEDVPVIGITEGSVDTAISKNLQGHDGRGGKSGVVIHVPHPEIPDTIGETASHWQLRLPIQVMEHVVVNRGTGGTGKKLGQLVMRVAHVLNCAFFDSLETITTLDRPDPVVSVGNVDGVNISQVNIVANFDDQDPAGRCEAVTIAAQGSGGYVLATATAGASIYYTLDGSLPGPANAVSTVADGSGIEPGDGEQLRALAWKDDKTPSGVLSIGG